MGDRSKPSGPPIESVQIYPINPVWTRLRIQKKKILKVSDYAISKN